MIRHLAYLAPLALLGLSACSDTPAALTKAKEGECYTVVGREPGGGQKWERTECASGDQAATAPIEQPQPVAETGLASDVSAAPPVAAACPTTPVVCPTVVKTAAPQRARVQRRAARQTTRQRQVETRDYVRVYTPDYPQPDLLGGPPPHHGDGRMEHRREPREHAYHPPAPYPAPLPPPPPAQRYEKRDHAYGYGHSYQPPRPAPAPYVEERRYGHQESRGYSRREEYSSREYERRSYSSESSGYSRYGPGCCDRPDRSAMAPMNGPHFPVDADGFLTWRGKTR